MSQKTTFKLGVLSSILILSFVSAHAADTATACTFKVDRDSVKVGWTAFKTTKKAGVKGGFDKVSYAGPAESPSLRQALLGSVVSIETSSVNTGDVGRDANLLNFFFKLATTESIRAFVSDVKIGNDNNVAGSATLTLVYNGKSKQVPMAYTVNEGKRFEMNGKINVLDLGLSPALKSLNKACFELHKGADKVSKTWPDVEIRVEAAFDKSC
jgi:polyisoprenoid-binding protein YceI